jgi:hypothetical protein
MNADTTRARLTAYAPFETGDEVGFALPVFQSKDGHYLVQHVSEFDGRIERFDRVDTSGTELVRAQSSLEVSSGDYAHYSFVNESKAWHIGTLKDMKPELIRFYNKCSDYIFLNLQIAELVGSNEMRVEARLRVHQSLAGRAGHAASRAFVVATLRHSLWSCLWDSARNREAAMDLILCRRQIFCEADWRKPELLPSTVWERIRFLIKADPRDIVSQLRSEGAALDLKGNVRWIDIYTADDGVPLQMPYGSTPVDVAYLIHTKLGDETVGAKINGRVAPLRTWLEHGDRLEIIRSRQQHAQPTWLSYVYTDYAYRMVERSIRRRSPLEPAD